MKFPRVNLPIPWQCPAPGKEPTTVRDRRAGWRITVLVLVLVPGLLLICSGRDLPTALTAVAGLGLAGATVAGWLLDGVPLPAIGAFLARSSGGAFLARSSGGAFLARSSGGAFLARFPGGAFLARSPGGAA
jgi:hypothetical protein